MANCNKKQCSSSVEPKHATSVFSSSSSQSNLSGVLEAVFNVPVATDKPLSCRKCVESAKTIHTKLQSLQLMARASYQSILSSPLVDHQVVTTKSVFLASSQKRAKDTSSGPGISPPTLKSQPPRKRRPGVGKTLHPSPGISGKQC